MNGRQQSILEKASEIPVRDEVDVLVAGGGLGGVSAAMAAARAGARTLLIERNGFLGGVATAGMCCSIFNCFYTADHRLGVTGNALEVADALAEAAGYGAKWHKHKGHIIYDVEQAKGVLACSSSEAGAQVLYDTVVAGAVMDGETMRGVIVESKSGREAILAGSSSTPPAMRTWPPGRARLCTRRRAPPSTATASAWAAWMSTASSDYFVEHPDQYPEYMDVDWRFEEALAQYRDTGTFLFPHGGAMQMDIFQNAGAAGAYPETVGVHDTLDACQMHAIRDTGIVHLVTGHVTFHDLDIGKISRGDDRRPPDGVGS